MALVSSGGADLSSESDRERKSWTWCVFISVCEDRIWWLFCSWSKLSHFSAMEQKKTVIVTGKLRWRRWCGKRDVLMPRVIVVSVLRVFLVTAESASVTDIIIINFMTRKWSSLQAESRLALNTKLKCLKHLFLSKYYHYSKLSGRTVVSEILDTVLFYFILFIQLI